MLIALAGGGVGAAGLAAYAVRGRSSRIFGPSVWRGPRDRRAIALTFDDGPSESTPQLLRLLDQSGARATFFQCGVNVRRLPAVAREVASAGHEIGNHSWSHARLYLRTPRFIGEELQRAQHAIAEIAGISPTLFRAPFGCRWPGLAAAQRRLGLLGVMWTVLGRDWKLAGAAVAARLLRRAANGSIICLHDGRELRPDPDIGPTLDAVRQLVPELRERGFRFLTVSELLCPTN